MAVMPRQTAFTPVSASLLLNVYAAEIERAISGTFGNLTNTSRPRFLLNRTSSLPIRNNTDTTIPWQSAVSNPRAMWTGSAADLVTVVDAGDWLIFGQERWPVNGTGSRAAKIQKNNPVPGSASIASSKLPGQSDGEGSTVNIFSYARLAINDILYLNCWQNSGGDLNILTDFGGTFFGGVWLGP